MYIMYYHHYVRYGHYYIYNFFFGLWYEYQNKIIYSVSIIIVANSCVQGHYCWYSVNLHRNIIIIFFLVIIFIHKHNIIVIFVETSVHIKT